MVAGKNSIPQAIQKIEVATGQSTEQVLTISIDLQPYTTVPRRPSQSHSGQV